MDPKAQALQKLLETLKPREAMPSPQPSAEEAAGMPLKEGSDEYYRLLSHTYPAEMPEQVQAISPFLSQRPMAESTPYEKDLEMKKQALQRVRAGSGSIIE